MNYSLVASQMSQEDIQEELANECWLGITRESDRYNLILSQFVDWYKKNANGDSLTKHWQKFYVYRKNEC